jgi:dihydroorotate dehydrogenase
MLRLPSRKIHHTFKYPVQRLSPRYASTSSSVPRSPIRTGLYTSAVAIAVGLFAVYYSDSRSAIHRYLITPLLRYTLDPEEAHKFAVKVLRSGLAPRDWQADSEKLKTEVRFHIEVLSFRNESSLLRFGVNHFQAP